MKYPVLVLLYDYTPFRVVDWKRAFVWMSSGKVDVIEYGEDVVHSPGATWQVPSIIRIPKTLSSKVKVVRFSRSGVWARDGAKCQYCGVDVSRKEFTFDHVVPRAQGGKTTWTNVVTCCFECNQRKGCRPLSESGMSLRSHPTKPSFWNLIEREILKIGKVPEMWIPYLPDRP